MGAKKDSGLIEKGPVSGTIAVAPKLLFAPVTFGAGKALYRSVCLSSSWLYNLVGIGRRIACYIVAWLGCLCDCCS